MRTWVCEFEMHLYTMKCKLLLYLNAWYQVYGTGYICRRVLAVAPDADHPTRTLTRSKNPNAMG